MFDHLNAFALKWVELLESTDIPQIAGNLDDGVGCCCLGVACRLAVDEGLLERPRPAAHNPRLLSYGPGGHTASLPQVVTRALGLYECTGAIPVRAGGGPSLIELNDIQGKSFAEIACYVRDTPALFGNYRKEPRDEG